MADDANWMSVGGAGNFSKNPWVSMDREHVQIAVKDASIHVKATFWFKNHGPATKLTMAFPDETTVNNVNDEGPSPSVISHMTSSVDGFPVPIAKKTLKPANDMQLRAVWLKEVSFARGQSRTVIVEYEADNGFAGNGWVLNSYILTSGATWRGKIGQCRIDVDWRELNDLSKPAMDFVSTEGKAVPAANWRFPGYRRATITLYNIEPTYDLDLSMISGFWNFTLNGRKRPQNLGATTTDSGVALEGKPKDIQIAVENLGQFFGEYTDQCHDMASPEAAKFGRELSLDGERILVTGKGKRLRLCRPAIEKTYRNGESHTFVYLRDVIQALGGKWRFIGPEERIVITMPRSKAKRR
ncbi:MAG: hypothetical protein J0H02_01965 [Armatimonadetes bacterium]|nr:hypothetical protein [Armatimonadota bacterium]